MQRGNWDGAIEEIKAAQAVFKSEPRMSAQLSLMLSECYNQTNSPELQLTALRNAVEGGVGSENSQFELAKALVRSDQPGELERALRILRTLVASRPEAEIEIARLLIRRTQRLPREQRDREWRLAEEQLAKTERLVQSGKLRPEVAEVLTLLRAEILVARNALPQARTLLTKARTKDRRNPRYIVALSRLALRQDPNSPEALNILDQAEKEIGAQPRTPVRSPAVLVRAEGRPGQSRGGETGRGA